MENEMSSPPLPALGKSQIAREEFQNEHLFRFESGQPARFQTLIFFRTVSVALAVILGVPFVPT